MVGGLIDTSRGKGRGGGWFGGGKGVGKAREGG